MFFIDEENWFMANCVLTLTQFHEDPAQVCELIMGVVSWVDMSVFKPWLHH